MMTHLKETQKIQNKVTYSSTMYYSFFLIDKLKFLVGVSISNSQKLIEEMYRKVSQSSSLVNVTLHLKISELFLNIF